MMRCLTPLPRATLIVLAIMLAIPTASLAKSFALTGVIDCGVANGDRCSLADTVKLTTSDIDGSPRKVEVDVSWIKSTIEEEGFDQDDAICLEVNDDQPDHLQATGLILTCDLLGTDNPGRSTRSHVAREQAKPKQDKENEEDTNQPALGSLLDRINALPCSDVSGGYECPIPAELIDEANSEGLRFDFTLPSACALVLRPTGTFIVCGPR